MIEKAELTDNAMNQIVEVVKPILEKKDKEIERLQDLCNKYEEEHKTTFEEWKKAINIIKEVREYINKHCVNEKESKEMGFKCYTMADTNELEHIMKLLDKEKNNEDN